MSNPWDSMLGALEERKKFARPLDVVKLMEPNAKTPAALKILERELIEAVSEPNKLIIVNVFPQLGKSTLISYSGPAWALYHNPDLRIFTGSYNQDKADEIGDYVRSNLKAMGVRISRSTGSKGDFHLADSRGRFYATGVGGGTGKPADLIIIDDAIKNDEESKSLAAQEKQWSWWQSVIFPRMGGGCSIIYVGTRFGPDDITARLIKEHGTVEEGGLWKVINIPAQCVDEENDPLGRKLGEFAENTRGWDTKEWELKKKLVGARMWGSLYQGDPIPIGGNMMRPEWVEIVDRKDLPTRDEGVWFGSWDLAFTGTDKSDYVVGQIWCYHKDVFYLVDQVRGQWNFPQTIERFKALQEEYSWIYKWLIEGKANGDALIDSLRRENINGLIRITPRGDKVSRVNSISYLLDAGRVKIVDSSFTKDFLTEVAEFPHGRHDDMVDAMSQGLSYTIAGLRPPRKRGVWGS